jgi:mycofactocin precursor
MEREQLVADAPTSEVGADSSNDVETLVEEVSIDGLCGVY